MSIRRHAPPWVRTHRRALRGIAQLVVLGLVTWFLVVPQVRGSAHSLHLLVDVDNSWIPIALIAEVASLAFYSFATRAMLRRPSRLPVQRVLRIDLSSIALSHCVPDGGAAGTALCWRLLVDSGVPSSDAAFAKLAQGVGAAVVLQALLLGTYVTGALLGNVSKWIVAPAVVSVGVLTLFSVAAACASRTWFRRWVSDLLRRIPRYGATLTAATARLFRHHVLTQFAGPSPDRRRFARSAGWAGANWVFDCFALWASLHAYGPGVGLAGCAAAFGIANAAAWVPVTPSGLGISEGLMIPALVAFGSTQTAAVLGVLTWRLVAYWLPLPIGAIAYGSLRLRRRPVACPS